MDGTKWYASKTLWVNILSVLGVVVDQLMGAGILGPKAMAILGVVNVGLRAITSGPLKV